MEKLWSILTIIVPIAAAISVGIMARRWQILTREGADGLQQFAVRIALPCVLFNSCLTSSFQVETLTSMVLVWPLLLAGALWAFRARRGTRFPYHNLPLLFAAQESGTLFKAHIMRVLWQYGLADGMYNEVYRSLFGLKPVRGRVLHTPRYEPVDDVLALIKACRGVAVLAHPSVYHSMELARELIAAGRLDGVEIDHPRNTPEDKAELLRLAKANDLLVTGGTDYHGLNTVTPRPVGAFYTRDEEIARLEALAKARKMSNKKAR